MLTGADVLTRLGNAWAHYVGGGVDRPAVTPSTVVAEAPHATLRRYDVAPGTVVDSPDDTVDGTVDGTAHRDPILLVPPLAVSIRCFDLRPEQSLAAFLLGLGRPLYVVDYGEIGFADRAMGLEDWIDQILPSTIERVSRRHGGRPVDVVTWSLGGTLSLLAAAAHPELPLRSITAVGTPIDYSKVAYLAPLRLAGHVDAGRSVTFASRLAGGVPGWAVRASFRATALQREITKPWFVLRHLDDVETLSRMEAVDGFIGEMPGYPGRLYGQIHHRLVLRNDLARGALRLGRRRIALADVRVPVLAIAGRTDAIAPIACAGRIRDVLTGANLEFVTAPGSHLGLLTGPEARATTWEQLRHFLDAQQEASAATVAGRERRPLLKAVADRVR